MMLTIFVLAIIITCVAMMLAEGLWSNTLSLVNAILAAMIASNSFEMVATFLEEYFPSFTYWLDFLSLWGVFTLSYAVIRELTDRLSRTRVRFKKPIEQFGRIGVAALTGWIVVCFFLFSLHTAPLVRKSFGGAFRTVPRRPAISSFPRITSGWASCRVARKEPWQRHRPTSLIPRVSSS